MLICGVDPGINTGYALLDYVIDAKAFVIIEKGVLRDEPDAVVRYIANLPADVWAIESFMLVYSAATMVARNDPHLLTVQVIGGLKYAIPHAKRFFQPPSTKKATPDNVLKELNLWDGILHTRDAMRHAVYFAKGLGNERVKPKKIKGLPDSNFNKG